MSVSEEEVGIRLYANGCPGFSGILKHRFADFKVNEVTLDGRVLRLTSLDPPPAAAPTTAEEEAAAVAASDPAAAVEAAMQRYAAIAGADSEEEPLRAFLRQALEYQAAAAQRKADRGRGGGRGGGGGDAAAASGAAASPPVQPPPPLVLAPMADKEQRTAMHRFFKSLPGFPQLTTNTVDALEQRQQQGDSAQQQQPAAQKQQQGGAAPKLQCIEVEVAAGGGGRGGRGQKRKWRDDSGWAGGSQRYTKFVLYKENMDSQQALSSLAKMLHVSHKLFAVAGTKDKRGVTVQQVTAFKLDPARLAGLNPRLRGMRVGNFEFADDQLRLGDLRGNRFELVLRGIEAPSAEAVAAAAEGLKRSGFINYYGLQRFGTGAVATHRVGQALLRGQWREAVRMLLTPRADCTRGQQVEACRLYLGEGDVAGALRLMPRFLLVEPLLLQGLQQGSNNFLNALMLIPRNLRSMYIHAYQSYLWNAAASHRIQTYGADGVVEGDLVLPRNDAARAASRNRGQAVVRQAEGPAAAAGDDGAEEGGTAIAAEEAEGAAAEEEAVDAGAVHVVTAEEAAAGAYTIDDVVLPLPGRESVYPQHATAGVYRQLAAADGVALDASPHGAQDFSITALPGAYRHVLFRPADLEYELVRYRHPDADLATTDLQALQGAAAAAPVPPGDDGGGEEGEGRLLGLRLAFTLPASCYATMLIRELTKQPTSVAHHKALQQQPQQEQQPAAAAEQQEGQQQEQEEGVGGEPAAGTA